MTVEFPIKPPRPTYPAFINHIDSPIDKVLAEDGEPFSQQSNNPAWNANMTVADVTHDSPASRFSNARHQIPRLIDLARHAATERAVSYRGFNVGACAYVLSAHHERGEFVLGANFTPYKGAAKYCAEMEIVQKARQGGFSQIAALAIFGPVNFDDVNLLETITLHPCHECRTLIADEPLFSDNTLIVTVNEKDMECMSMRGLIDLHS